MEGLECRAGEGGRSNVQVLQSAGGWRRWASGIRARNLRAKRRRQTSARTRGQQWPATDATFGNVGDARSVSRLTRYAKAARQVLLLPYCIAAIRLGGGGAHCTNHRLAQHPHCRIQPCCVIAHIGSACSCLLGFGGKPLLYDRSSRGLRRRFGSRCGRFLPSPRPVPPQLQRWNWRWR
jgi:hypothetical protein